jgi:hypothetical protein
VGTRSLAAIWESLKAVSSLGCRDKDEVCNPPARTGRFVSGHELTRAEAAAETVRALQFAEKLNTSGFVTGHDFTACGKTQPRGFVTGHDFSRADIASKMSWALAPAGSSFAGFAFRSDFFRSLFSLCALHTGRHHGSSRSEAIFQRRFRRDLP